MPRLPDLKSATHAASGLIAPLPTLLTEKNERMKPIYREAPDSFVASSSSIQDLHIHQNTG
ncbi:hypothetical protein HG66A1_32250 [Gimesia chilikensis]|uniref:Uncharacterized protein n=1 Tax=Gimesia chilikensis TaxID=2605989 RepID=A0A517PPW6_9PLAN|nr:hypothetical protein HG66A1_32250 [Gimesia chilikensis]